MDNHKPHFSSVLTQENKKLLDKTIALHRHYPECIDHMQDLIRICYKDKGSFTDFFEKVGKLLNCASPEEEEKIRADLLSILEGAERNSLSATDQDNKEKREEKRKRIIQHFKQIKSSSFVKEIFFSEPRYADLNFEEEPHILYILLTITSIADITPDNQKMFISSDKVYTRLMSEQVISQENVEVTQNLIMDVWKTDLAQLVYLQTTELKLLELIEKMVERGSWCTEIQDIESYLDAAAYSKVGKEETEKFSQEVQEFLQITAPDGIPQDVSEVFVREPRFSAIEEELIRLFLDYRQEIMHILKKASHTEDTLKETLEENERQVFENWEKLMDLHIDPNIGEAFKAQKEIVYKKLQTRIEANHYLIRLRAFTLLDILHVKWNPIARKLRQNGLRYIIDLQKEALDYQQDNLSEREELKEEAFLRFLQLRPYYDEIDKEDIYKYFAISPLDLSEESKPVWEESVHYEDFLIRIDQDIEEENEAGETKEIPKNRYRISVPEEEEGKVLTATFTLTDKDLNDMITSYQYGDGTQRNEPVRGIAYHPRYRFESLRHLGTFIYRKLFKESRSSSPKIGQGFIAGRLESFIRRTLHKENDNPEVQTRIRLMLEIKVPDLQRGPWEALYIPSFELFPSLRRLQYSVVRITERQESAFRRSLGSRLRILIVTANTRKMTYLNSIQERYAIKEAMSYAEEKNQVDTLALEDPNFKELTDTIRRFRPHIFHFGGHAGFRNDNPVIVLRKKQGGEEEYIRADQLKTELGENSNLSLIILNGCETGSTSGSDTTLTSLAETLVAHGTPAVIASTRKIMDKDSILFSKEFYRSFSLGNPAEVAIAEARIKLDTNLRDWTPYSLFTSRSDVSELHTIRLSAPRRVDIR